MGMPPGRFDSILLTTQIQIWKLWKDSEKVVLRMDLDETWWTGWVCDKNESSDWERPLRHFRPVKPVMALSNPINPFTPLRPHKPFRILDPLRSLPSAVPFRKVSLCECFFIRLLVCQSPTGHSSKPIFTKLHHMVEFVTSKKPIDF